MRIIEADEVTRLLDVKSCIQLMRETLAGLEEGRGVQYLRTPHVLPDGNVFAFMPASLGEGYFGAKLITVFHSNHGSAYPSHQGQVMLFGAKHGDPLALVEASSLTGVRTGAVSAVATGLLARQNAEALALLGCGVQAQSHLRAIAQVRQLKTVYAWDLDPARAKGFAEAMQAETGITVNAVATAKAAVQNADIVCTLTPSKTPVLESEWIRPGTHVNAVGACLAADRELPSALVARARLYCDAMESARKEAGDYLIPLAEGAIQESHLLGTVGGVAVGTVPGRQSDADITIFEALGLAIEDIAAARYVYEKTQG